MTGLARIEEARRWLRDRLPLAPGHALFLALVLLTPYARLYANFYYILLLIPFLLLLDARDGRALAGSWVLRFALAYLGLLWLSSFWTPDTPPQQILRLGRHILANFSFIAVTAWLVARDQGHVARLCRSLAGAAVITALVSLWLFHVEGHQPHGWRLTAWLWPNPNTAGAVFGLACVAAAAGSTPAAGPALLRRLALVAATVLAVAVALTGSRSALAGIAASGLAWLILGRTWRQPGGRAVAASAVVGLAVAGWITTDEWLARGDNGRLELWSHFWAVGWQRPWLGWGLRQDLAFTIANGLHTDDPHSMLLETLMRTGMLGVLAWGGAIIAGLVAGYRHWRRHGGFAPLGLTIYLATQGIFESAVPINPPDWFWILLWIPVGIAAGVEVSPTDRGRPAR
jgi:O-antigen ligase